MAKNRTLSLPDKLSERMEKLSEVNWSEVARNAFEEYLNIRKEPEISDIIERLTKEKNKQYAIGFAAASNIAKKLNYEKFIEIFIDYDIHLEKEEDRINPAPRSTDVLNTFRMGTLGISSSASERKKLPEDVKKSILVELFEDKELLKNAGISKEFERGFYDAMLKFREAVGE